MVILIYIYFHKIYLNKFIFKITIIFLDNILNNTLNQCGLPGENGNNVQSTTSGLEVETNTLPEATVLAQVAQRSSAKYLY